MQTNKVSPKFSKFLAKNTTALADAKKAEARANNCPVPVGAEGVAVITEMVFDVGNDKKKEDGTVQEGKPYCRMEFRIVDNQEHAGKVLKKAHYFNNTTNATAVDRYEWFLNELEYMGLDRDLRVGHEDPQQLVDYFMREPYMVQFKVVAGNPQYDDGKVIRFSRMPEQVPDIPHTGGVSGKEKVKYLGREWEVVSKDGTKLTILDPTTQKTKEVEVKDLD